jgi:histidine phosphotransferase ChpT
LQTTLDDHAVRLAATVATRLCHDVAGLLGILAGTLDLADEDPEAKLLAAETAQTLMTRVRLLRAAWGGDAGAMDAGAIDALAAGIPGIERLRLDFSGLSEALAETPARLLLCLLLAAAPGLSRGTLLSFGPMPHGGVRISIAGSTAAWPALLVACASGESGLREAATSARDVAMPFAYLLARDLGWLIRPEENTVMVIQRP